MARKSEVFPPTAPLFCDHITTSPFFGPPCRWSTWSCQWWWDWAGC